MCGKVVSEDPIMLKYFFDRYQTQTMFNNVVDFCLLELKFVPAWFVTSKIIEKPDSAVFSDGNIVFGDLDSDFVTFLAKVYRH